MAVGLFIAIAAVVYFLAAPADKQNQEDQISAIEENIQPQDHNNRLELPTPLAKTTAEDEVVIAKTDVKPTILPKPVEPKPLISPNIKVGPSIRPADTKPIGETITLKKQTSPIGTISIKSPTVSPVIPTVRKAPKTYTVQKGDNGFQAVAVKMYGNSSKWRLIKEANPKVDTYKLQVGQKLIIPPLPDKPKTLSASPVTIVTSSGSKLYIVQDGDQGFWGVAKKVYGHGKYSYLIGKANPNAVPNELQIGQKLIIPPLTEVKKSSTSVSAAQPTASAARTEVSDEDARPVFD